MKKQLLILFALVISVIGYTQTFNSTDSNGNVLEYNVTSATTVQVSGITQANTIVEIPSSVTNASTSYSVTRIDDMALAGSGVQISSISLPNTLISIGQQALSGNSLTSIVFPNSLILSVIMRFNLTNYKVLLSLVMLQTLEMVFLEVIPCQWLHL